MDRSTGFLRTMDSLTPLFEKVMLPIGVVVAALNIADISGIVGIVVGLVTICMVVPRAIMNWHEVYTAWKTKREEKKRLKEAKQVCDRID